MAATWPLARSTTSPRRGLRDEGHQVVGDAFGILSDEPAGMGAHGIEIPKKHHRPVALRLCSRREDLLTHELGPTIGVGASARAGILIDGHVVVRGIDRRGRGENDLLHAVADHSFAEVDSGVEVVFKIEQRLLHAFAHGLEPREVEHTVK